MKTKYIPIIQITLPFCLHCLFSLKWIDMYSPYSFTLNYRGQHFWIFQNVDIQGYSQRSCIYVLEGINCISFWECSVGLGECLDSVVFFLCFVFLLWFFVCLFLVLFVYLFVCFLLLFLYFTALNNAASSRWTHTFRPFQLCSVYVAASHIPSIKLLGGCFIRLMFSIFDLYFDKGTIFE